VDRGLPDRGVGLWPLSDLASPVDALVTASCIGLADTCGPAGTSSCCGSSLVPGGTFARGHDVAADGMYPSTSFPATISDFNLDTYEVTVGRFRQFVNAGQGTQVSAPAAGAGAHANIAGSGWLAAWNSNLAATTNALKTALACDASFQTWTNIAGPGDNRPINCVTWYEAMAFCAWDGGFLPTEAQWNYAAAGGSEQRAFAWSNPPGSLTLDCSHCNYTPASPCVAAGPNRVGSESPTGDGKWGHADLTGNVFEWTLDWMAGYGTPCTDCADLTQTAMRTLRGGDFGNAAVNLRTAYRGSSGTPTTRDSGVGIRCARP
jgi:formylglycine-generating enzyme required for sulfatase activity